MKKKNILWEIILIFGILPFVISLVFGIYSAITGFSGLCILSCKDIYGLQAFVDSIVMYSYIFWPTYVIGIILLIISIIILKAKVKDKQKDKSEIK